LSSVASTGVPVVEEITGTISTVRTSLRKARPLKMLNDSIARPSDDRGEPPERNPIVDRQPERSQIKPLRRLKISLSSQPRIKGFLVKEQLPAPSPVPPARRKLADRRRKPVTPAPATQIVMRPSMPRSPHPQRRRPGREIGARLCRWHGPMIGHGGTWR
jgi:hypothetical protein